MSGTGTNETDKESPSRRVYVLLPEQVDEIRAYQARNGISSEVEAVRRLLEIALRLRDTIPDILKKLKARLSNEKDLRVLGRDILSMHPLVKSVHFEEDALIFTFNANDRGKIDSNGRMFMADASANDWDDWDEYPDPRRPAHSGGTPSWDAPKGGDLDDEIPF